MGVSLPTGLSSGGRRGYLSVYTHTHTHTHTHTGLFLYLDWKLDSPGNLIPAPLHTVLSSVPFLSGSDKSDSSCPNIFDDITVFDHSPRGWPVCPAPCPCLPMWTPSWPCLGADSQKGPPARRTPCQRRHCLLLWVTLGLRFTPPPTLPRPGSDPCGGFRTDFSFPQGVFAVQSQ